MQRILVTGATGNVGGQVVSQLLTMGVNIRAMVRHPGSAHLPRQVEVMRGDLMSPESLAGCLEGVDAVFLVWAAPATGVVPALERITKTVPRVVFLSNLTVRDDVEEQNYAVSDLHIGIERSIAASGVRWTFLRPGAFATNARIWWARQIRGANVVRWPYADAATSPIHEGDIAAVAVRALCQDGHAGARYLLTGPASLTHREQIRILGEAIGRPLHYEEIAPEVARREMTAIMPPAIADMLLGAWSNAAGRPAPVTATVAEITGRPARSFHEWAMDHTREFQP
ncbi:MAG TPA: NAD(P)H-binding protein [Bryobacteraceae bacterium]|nr:NAD(P)H-binding protein [Bryobacteraceae bacterium]